MPATLANEPSALIRLLVSRSDGLRRYITSRIPSRLRRIVSADDILQDVFITVVRRAADLSATGLDDIDVWLTRTAQQRIADAIRRVMAKKRGGHCGMVYEEWQRGSFVDLFERVCAGRDTPSKEMSAKEAVSAVQLALAALPEKYRMAITLRYIHGSSYDQVAKAMSKSRTAVNNLLHRGLCMLKALMPPISQLFSDDGTETAEHPRRGL